MENPATRSILKPSRSSHSHSRSQSSPRKPAVTIAEPASRSPTGKPAQDFTITFPNVHSARQLEELAFDFARRIQSRRLEDDNGKGRAKEIEMASSPMKAGRPTHQSDDYPEFRDVLTGPWQSGAHYAPIFEPFVVTKLDSLRINPRVTSSAPARLRWNVTQPVSSAICVFDDGEERPLDAFLHEPLTAPRLAELQIISRSIPWAMSVRGRTLALGAGVTLADFFSMISRTMCFPLSDNDLKALNDKHRQAYLETYRRRCPAQEDVPRFYDLLLGNTTFGGLVYDREYERERFPGTRWGIHLRATYLPNIP